MKKKEIVIHIQEYDSSQELSDEDQELIKIAQEAALVAYSPYSGFSVGAAVLLANGKIVKGSNQENAAYPSGLCAERVALFYANSEYPESSVKTIAICAKNKTGFLANPITPCGSCRQVILETTERYNQDIRIILYGTKTIQIIENSKLLLPLHFQKSDL